LPTGKALGCTDSVATPFVSVTTPSGVPPLFKATFPLAVGVPAAEVTATVIVSACAVVMLDEDGVTVTVGVVLGPAVTVTSIELKVLL
jgi:hypothetical protein